MQLRAQRQVDHGEDTCPRIKTNCSDQRRRLCRSPGRLEAASGISRRSSGSHPFWSNYIHFHRVAGRASGVERTEPPIRPYQYTVCIHLYVLPTYMFWLTIFCRLEVFTYMFWFRAAKPPSDFHLYVLFFLSGGEAARFCHLYVLVFLNFSVMH